MFQDDEDERIRTIDEEFDRLTPLLPTYYPVRRSRHVVYVRRKLMTFAELERSWTRLRRRRELLSAEVLEGFDAVLISTDHDAVDYVLIHDYATLIVDTRNVMAKNGLSGKSIVKA